jgi:hypothetical protein
MNRQRVFPCSVLALCILVVGFCLFRMQNPGAKNMLTAAKRSEVSSLLSSFASREHRVPTLANDIQSALSGLEDFEMIHVRFLRRVPSASGRWKYIYEMSRPGVSRKVLITVDYLRTSP